MQNYVWTRTRRRNENTVLRDPVHRIPSANTDTQTNASFGSEASSSVYLHKSEDLGCVESNDDLEKNDDIENDDNLEKANDVENDDNYDETNDDPSKVPNGNTQDSLKTFLSRFLQTKF